MRSRAVDVAVVGAGLSGLSAALRLREAGLTVCVLEARDRVGGRLRTVTAAGHPVDLGGTWIGAGDRRLKALVAELGLATFPTHSAGEDVVLNGGRARRGRRHRRLHPLATIGHRRAVRRLEELAAGIDPARPWAGPDSERLDATTLAAWLRREVRTARARSTVGETLTSILATCPEDVSLLGVLGYLNSGGGLSTLLGVDGGAQERFLAGGAQAVAEGMAERLTDALELAAPVRRIEHDARGVRVIARGLTVAARHVIVALPPGTAANLDFDPMLPRSRTALLGGLRVGPVVRLVAVYDDAFWRADGLSGAAWGPAVRFSFTYDLSPPAGTPGVLSAFLVGGRAAGDPRERRTDVLDGLAACFGPRAGRPRDLIEADWSRDPWSAGAYGVTAPPGLLTRHGDTMRRPDGRIIWAGAELAVSHQGYMEGAIEAGERAAAAILESSSGLGTIAA